MKCELLIKEKLVDVDNLKESRYKEKFNKY